MNIQKFSYDEYKKILFAFKSRFKNIKQAKNHEEFVILRHDVEFSLERALELAKIDFQCEVESTFFIQVYSSAYNAFSYEEIKRIKKIKDLGHEIGLHLYVSHLNVHKLESLIFEIEKQKKIFEIGLDLSCNIFSYHRPPKWVLDIRADNLCNMINVYGPSFFEYAPEPVQIKYISDSMHKWSYGYPLDYFSFSKIQLLIHPDEWTEFGSIDSSDNFKKLIKEKNNEFLNTLSNETKHFKRETLIDENLYFRQ